ncbi:Vanillin dehydrogenase [Vanrija pseudolonga]|uniref:Vanillin dehydrogenase n=1 Tax=Vanrija pseudolonga TaxID=143232 RepID=A0AAF1BH87_9TREE|nr:Vanillin dehydrogenase [Vanrija pseudolonga]
MGPTHLPPELVRNLLGAPPSPPTPDLKSYPVITPSTNNIAYHAERSSPSDIDTAVTVAHNYRRTWASTPLRNRTDVARRAAALLQDESSGWAERLLASNVAETSVSAWWASEQIRFLPGFMKHLASCAKDALAPEEVVAGNSKFTLTREPYGVCLAIGTWNAAQVLTMRAVLTPLIAGNTVVLKTSEAIPYTQVLWAELLYAAGLPREALTVVHVAVEDAEELVGALVADKRVRHVNFTGTTRVGSIIASLAGKHLKPTLMELGGKSPVLLLPDAPLEVAASHILFGAFMNSGQICMGTERVLVPASQYDELVGHLREAWAGAQVKRYATMHAAHAGDRIRELVADALANGASRVLGDAGDAGAGALVVPHVLGDVGPEARLYAEESFGPVAVLIKIPDDGLSESSVIDAMVAIANESEYGLSAAVWGRNAARAARVAQRLECGMCHINSPTLNDLPTVPHGGWKASGWGRFNSSEGLRNFTQVKSIEVPREVFAIPLDTLEL